MYLEKIENFVKLGYIYFYRYFLSFEYQEENKI